MRQPARPPTERTAVVCVGGQGIWMQVAEALVRVLPERGVQAVRLTPAADCTALGMDGIVGVAFVGLRPPAEVLARASAGDLRITTIGALGTELPAGTSIRYPAHSALALAIGALRSLGHRGIARLQGGSTDAGDPLGEVARDAGRDRPADALQPVTAVICDDAPTAAWAVLRAGQLGIRIPEDLSIVALADHPLLGAISPAVTAIREPVEAMALALADALTAHRWHAAGPTLKPRLTVRASIATPRFT